MIRAKDFNFFDAQVFHLTVTIRFSSISNLGAP